MLEGPAPELMSPPVAQPARNPNRAPEITRAPAPNFTELPPQLLRENNPQSPDVQPTPEDMKMLQQIMGQVQEQKQSVTPIISAPSNEKPELKIPVQEKKEATGLMEKIKLIPAKVKEVLKKIWYYGSGSFIWDKVFGK